MRRFQGRVVAVLSMLVAAGCSNGSSGPIPGPTPAVTPSATPIPTPAPTSTPSTAPTFPGPTNPPPMGTVGCNSPLEPEPGYYTSIETTGTVAGNTYTEAASGSNDYIVTSYAPGPTPTATPTTVPSFTPAPGGAPTATPSPTATPGTSTTPTPAPSPAYVLTTQYEGTYFVPGFGVAAATTGCFVLTLTQPEGGTAGQVRRRADATAVPNAAGSGGPTVAPFGTVIDTGSGLITSFTIANLTQTSGNGTFTLDNGVTGTVTILGSQSSYGLAVRPRAAAQRLR